MSEEKAVKGKEAVKEKEVSRRSVLKWTTALAAAGVVGAGIGYGVSQPGPSVGPTTTATVTTTAPPGPPKSFRPPLSPEIQARVDAITKQLIAMHAGDTTVMTSCTSNGCKGGPCAVLVHVKDGKMTTSENGDYLNRGVTIEDAYLPVEDTLKKNMIQIRPCTRGYLYPRTAYQPNRLMYPMKRVGARGERKFVRISWEEALDTCGNKVKELREKYGPYFADGGPGSDYLGYGWGTWGVGSRAGHVMSSMEMFGWSLFGKGNIGSTTNILSIFKTKAAVHIGTNPMLNYQANGCNSDKSYYLTWMHENGIPVIVIDPVYNFTCEVQGDQWIPIKAGTDMALLLAIANVLYKEGIYQKDYVAKYVYGFEKWMDYVTGKTAGPDGAIDRTPEWAEPITGIPAETIRELARFMAKNAPQLHFGMYFSVAKHMYGETTGWADDALKAMLGLIGTPGGHQPEGPFGNVSYITAASVSYGATPGTFTSQQLVSSNNGGDNCLWLYQELKAGKISEEVYKRSIGCAQDWPTPRPVMVFGKPAGIGSNNTNYLAKGLKAMEFVVTDGSSTFHVDNPSLFYSDIIMPAADSFYEQHQGFIRKVSEIQLALKCADPPGEARSSLWQSMQFEKRLGLLDKTQPKLKAYVDDPKKLDDAQLDLFKAGWESFIARAAIKPLNPPTWDQLLKQQIWHIPHIGESYSAQDKPPFDWFNNFIADPKKTPLDTPSGKMQVYSDRLTEPDMPTKGIVTPGGFVAEICYGGASPTLVPPMPQFVAHVQPDGPLTNFAEKYPLNMLSLHSNYRAHHSNDSNPDFRIEARHACWLSVADAKARGIKDGDLVHVFSPQGECVLPAYVTARVAPGTSNVGYGAWLTPSSVKSELMPDGVDMRGQHNALCPSLQYPWINGDLADQTNCQVEKYE